MAGAGGIFGYGLGNFMKYFQDARNHRDLVDMENRKQDLANREEDYKEAKENVVQENPDYDGPGSVTGGMLNANPFAKGFLTNFDASNPDTYQAKAHSPYPADQTSQKIDQSTGIVQPPSPIQTTGNTINQTMSPPAPQSMPMMPNHEQMGPPQQGQGLMPMSAPDREQMGPGLLGRSPSSDAPIDTKTPVPQETPDQISPTGNETAPGEGEIESTAPKLAQRFIPTANESARRGLESKGLQEQSQSHDPTSPINVMARSVLTNEIQQNLQFRNQMQMMMAKQLGVPVTAPVIQNMRPEDLVSPNLTINDFARMKAAGIDPALSGGGKGAMEMLGKMHAQMIADRNADTNERNATSREAMAGSSQARNRLQTNVQARAIHDDIVNNPVLQRLSVQKNSLDNGLERIVAAHKNGTLTPQDFHEFIMDQNNATNNTAAAGSDAKFHAGDYESALMRGKRFEQELGKINGNAVPEDFYQKAIANYTGLNNMLTKHQYEWGQKQYNPAINNPEMNQAQLDAIRQYIPDFSPSKRGKISAPKQKNGLLDDSAPNLNQHDKITQELMKRGVLR